jgi:uncharacterized cupin superfamily protein
MRLHEGGKGKRDAVAGPPDGTRQRLGHDRIMSTAGDCAAFPKGSGNGHHLVNKSGATAVDLEVGSRSPADVTICSDIDMMSSNADGRFVHKDGAPYPVP